MIKNKKEIALMTKASQIVAATHKYLKPKIKPGVTTNKLNELAEGYIIKNNAYPAFKGYKGFPKAICISINEEVVHGIPSKRILQDGYIIAIDIGVYYKGYYGDAACTYPVGEISQKKKELIFHTEKALYEAIKIVKEGIDINDIGRIIEAYLKPYGYGIVEDLVGHGIGKKLHEAPEILNYATSKKGLTLKAGMTLAIEPMINMGCKEVALKEDYWTIVTKDNQPSAHFEHTVLVTKKGVKILTKG